MFKFKKRKGGIGLTIFVLIFCFAWMLWIWRPIDYPAFTVMSSTYNSSFVGEVNSTASSSDVQAGTSFYPNPWSIFAGVFLSLLNFVTYPITIWGNIGLPSAIGTFLSSIMVVLYVIGVMLFFRGGDF